MEFLYGVIGTVAVLLVFAAGMLTGWKVKAFQLRSQRGTAEEPTEKEKRLLREELEAFQRVQNYTVDDAYGLRGQITSAHTDGV